MLFYREMGKGPVLLLLHGLFGSADNLGSLARALQQDYRVIMMDLRNHGRSPHFSQMDYQAMAEDVVAVMDHLALSEAIVFGHSMGGKVAMQLALDHPDRVQILLVGDIAPVKYPHHHAQILKGMRKVAEQAPDNRRIAAEILSAFEAEPAVVDFLVTNWRRDEKGQWGWRLNLDTIVNDYDSIRAAVTGRLFEKPVLFIKGGDSHYILAEHKEAISRLFPKADLKIIAGTGHWFHAEKPALTVRLVRAFIDKHQGAND